MAKSADYEFLASLRNTRPLSLCPEERENFHDTDDTARSAKALRLRCVWSAAEFAKQVNYPILVVAWNKRTFGRGKRAWLATFTAAERRKIEKYYARFYKWYLISGVPERIVCSLRTLTLLQRAVAFFADLS